MSDAFTRWVARPGPRLRDAEAEAIAADYIRMLELDCTVDALTGFLCGDNYTTIIERTVPADNAKEEARSLQQPGRTVAIEPLPDLGGRARRLITVSVRRPNLYQLCQQNRLNRQHLAGALEAVCRNPNPGERGATPAEFEAWRALFRAALMYGATGSEAHP